MVRATATVSPEDAENREVTWSSSNTAIARVRVVDVKNNAADVIGVSPGTVIITATAKDGSGVTASVPVTVIDGGESTYQSITITTSKAIGETIVMTVQGKLAASEVEGAVIIDSKTYANGNTEYTFELTKQTVTIKQASIAYILFTFDQITSVDLNNSPDLKSLYCYMNAIKGENMTNLVKSLPDRTGKTAGKIIVYASNDSREKNVITKADVAIAKAKNWNVLDWDNKEYEGI
jgi:cobalamin biosynthesis Mg chelatase CobN